MTHIWLTHMQYKYLQYDSEFQGNFLAYIIFPNPPTQIFKYRFSLKCVGVIFFRPHIRIQNRRRWTALSVSCPCLRFCLSRFFQLSGFCPVVQEKCCPVSVCQDFFCPDPVRCRDSVQLLPPKSARHFTKIVFDKVSKIKNPYQQILENSSKNLIFYG